MRVTIQQLFLVALIGLLPACALQAQAVPFQFQLEQGAGTLNITAGTQIRFTALAVDDRATARLVAVYRGSTSATFKDIPQILGNGAFTALPESELPATLVNGDSIAWQLSFLPIAVTPVTGQLAIAYREQTADADSFLQFPLSGSIPPFSVGASVGGGNVITLNDGDSIAFPPTRTGATAIASVVIVNRRELPITLNSVTVNGSAFSSSGVPLLPLQIGSAQSIEFQVRYIASASDTDVGTLRIGIAGTFFTAKLSGEGSGLRYELLNGGESSAVIPGQPLVFPETAVGDISDLQFRVSNTGGIPESLDAIALIGDAFAVSNLPFLPATIQPGQSLTLALRFTPRVAGENPGRLRVGGAEFPLAGTGIGSALRYSFTSSGTTLGLQPGGTIIFPGTSIGKLSSIRFQVSNGGGQKAVVNTIGIGTGSAVFDLLENPVFPISLEPGASTTFTITFTPNSADLVAGQFVIDGATFLLRGIGQSPTEPLTFEFTGASGAVPPLTQPPVGLRLTAPLPIPVAGELRLSVDSGAFPADPAVQFVTGGRTVSFLIPANATEARFANGLNQVQLQSGTVASAFRIRPVFVSAGNFDLTPENASALSLTVGTAAPSLQSILTQSNGSNALTVTVIGFATTRSLRSLTFTFTPKAGTELVSDSFTVDIAGPAGFWFTSPSSQSFGGLFQTVTTFSLSDEKGNTVPIQGVASVSVTAANETGASSAVNATIF